MDRLNYRVTLYKNRERNGSTEGRPGQMRLYGVGALQDHPRIEVGHHILLDAEKWEFAKWDDEDGPSPTGGTVDPLRGEVVALRWLNHERHEAFDAEIVVAVDLDNLNHALDESREHVFDFYWGG